jgi:hypothetical protein
MSAVSFHFRWSYHAPDLGYLYHNDLYPDQESCASASEGSRYTPSDENADIREFHELAILISSSLR